MMAIQAIALIFVTIIASLIKHDIKYNTIDGVVCMFICLFSITYICFFLQLVLHPKNAIIEMYYTKNKLSLAVICKTPISRNRYIIINLIPNIVLGIVFSLIWLLAPIKNTYLNIFLLCSGPINLALGVTNCINIFNCIMLPKDALIITPNIHSYWYVENKNSGG